MVLYMIIGLGQTLSNTWYRSLANRIEHGWLQSLFGLLASVIVFMALACRCRSSPAAFCKARCKWAVRSDSSAMSAAVVAGTIGAVATAGVGAVAAAWGCWVPEVLRPLEWCWRGSGASGAVEASCPEPLGA